MHRTLTVLVNRMYTVHIEFWSLHLLPQHLQNYLETCQECKDSEGIGKACEAIAKAYDRCGIGLYYTFLQCYVSYVMHLFLYVQGEPKK